MSLHVQCCVIHHLKNSDSTELGTVLKIEEPMKVCFVILHLRNEILQYH